jgi:S1-C subfamily serine protease
MPAQSRGRVRAGEAMAQLKWCGRLALAAAALLVTVVASAAIRRDPPVEGKDFPEAVLVESQGGGRRVAQGCGVLIGPKAVLTVAHGVAGFESWTVTAPYAPGGPQRRTARTVHVHPNHKPDDPETDLAVVRLEETLDVGRAYPRLYDGELLPLETKLVCLGRVANGRVSADRLYQAPSTLANFPGNVNLYGGFPAQTEPGDSGGPVFRDGRGERVLVALVLGRLGASRANVATDAFLPLSRRNAAWVRGRSAP